jgi:hypothetical protein
MCDEENAAEVVRPTALPGELGETETGAPQAQQAQQAQRAHQAQAGVATGRHQAGSNTTIDTKLDPDASIEYDITDASGWPIAYCYPFPGLQRSLFCFLQSNT